MNDDPLIAVKQLHVTFPTYTGPVKAVRGASFELKPGERVGLVGESGSGKSVTALALIGLLSRRQCRLDGEILFDQQNLATLPESRFRGLRGKDIAMIFQDPMTALNPTMRVGNQVAEAIRRHQHVSHKETRKRVLELLESVGITHPEERYSQFPHMLSGGMRQRVVIAIALACQPRLLIADEPTTALDPTLREQVMEVLRQHQEASGMALLLITHDIGLVARHCERTLVMYAGQLVEKGPTELILQQPCHPYTRGLLGSLPQANTNQPLLAIPGSPPDLRSPPPGCPFAPRCKHAMRICGTSRPALNAINADRSAACWLYDPRAPKVKL